MSDPGRAPRAEDAEAPLVDPERLARYLDGRVPGSGSFEIERHRAGHSNETFFIRRSGHEWVLRRPPRGAFLPTAHDVLREHRVLAALGGTGVRAPRTILACEDESVIGVPFYLMEKMDGVVIREELPGYLSANEGARRAMGEELVDALCELQEVDWLAVGLEGWGRPAGYLDRQLKRWKGQLDLTMPLTRPLPDLERLGAWLAEHRPESPAATIVQGDYKLDNVVFSGGPPPRLVAILDWEMATIGDPLADLGWMLAFWREPDDPADVVLAERTEVTRLPGFSSREELIERYRERTGREIGGIDWYVALAVYKLAILLEGSYARHLAGATDDPFFAELEQGVPALARRGLEVAALA